MRLVTVEWHDVGPQREDAVASMGQVDTVIVSY